MVQSNNRAYSPLLYPFGRMAGWKAMMLGLVSQLLAVVLAWRLGARYDGVLDFHLSADAGFGRILTDQLINVGALWLVFGIFLVIQAKNRFRWIDLFGMIAFSRWPLLLMPLTLMGGFFKRLTDYFVQTGKPASELPATADIFWLLLFSIVIILCTIWALSLLYQAYRILLHKEGVWPVVLFVAAVLSAEVLSKFLIYSTL